MSQEESMRILAIALALALASCGPGNGSDNDATDAPEEVADVVDDGTDDAVSDPEPEVGCTTDGDCDDSDPCTQDTCDTDYGTCEHSATDADGDGFGPREVDGTDCGGSDCNDDDEDVFPGSTVRRCDEDADCNDLTDSDNDDDGYDGEACSGDDCNDEDADVFPGSTVRRCDEDGDCNGYADSDNDNDTYARSDCSSGTDCNDEDDTVHPGADEVCVDGIDQDCDTLIDGPIVRITEAVIAEGDLPSTTWIGGEMGVSWTYFDGADDNVVYRGVPLSCIATGRSRTFTTGTMRKYSTVVWTGSELGIVWEDDRYMNPGPYFSLLSGGSVTVSEFRVNDYTSSGNYPHMAWSGSQFAIVWSDTRNPGTGYVDDIYMALLDAAGAKIGGDIQISESTGDPNLPSVTWTGSEWGLAWHDDRDGQNEIYFARVSDTGTKVGSDVRITSETGSSSSPSLAWTGSEFGVAWGDHRDGYWQIYFARISAAGAKVGTDMRITSTTTDASEVDMLWAGSFFTLAWQDMRHANMEIYATRLAADGTELDTQTRITNAVGVSHYVDTTWTGSELGLVWGDLRTSPTSVLAGYVSYCE